MTPHEFALWFDTLTDDAQMQVVTDMKNRLSSVLTIYSTPAGQVRAILEEMTHLLNVLPVRYATKIKTKI